MSETFIPSGVENEAEKLVNSSIIGRDLRNPQTLEIVLSHNLSSADTCSTAHEPAVVSGQTDKKSSLGWLDRFSKIGALFCKNPKAHGETVQQQPKMISVAEILIEKARGMDLTQVSPLGALQLGIERINFEAIDSAAFKANLAETLFSQRAKNSGEVIETLWEKSEERKVVSEIFAIIAMSKEVGRPITFRDAFNRVYESKRETERTALDRISKALILGR